MDIIQEAKLMIARERALQANVSPQIDLISRLLDMREWKPRDTAPMDGTKFLIMETDGEMAIGEYYTIVRDEYIEQENGSYKKIQTKKGLWNNNYFEWWMPLPLPPAGDLKNTVSQKV